MESLRCKDRKPTHPGGFLREIVFPELDMTQAELAFRLKVSRRTISELLHERRPLTPDMALRLSRLLGRSAGSWLKMQQAVDLWELERTSSKKYADIRKAQQSVERKAG